MAARMIDDGAGFGTGMAMGSVALVRWPNDHAQVERLRELGRPRLLLVDQDAPAPFTVDIAEDWIRLPASEEDLHARSVALAAKSAAAVPSPASVRSGRLVYGGDWVALSPIEEAIVSELVNSFAEVVELERLTDLAQHRLTANAVRVHVMRLRKRILPLGLVVRTVHGRGYLIERSDSAVATRR